MNISELKYGGAVRWDTFDNKIYFNIEKGSVGGRLVLKKDSDGKIDMYILNGDTTGHIRQSS